MVNYFNEAAIEEEGKKIFEGLKWSNRHVAESNPHPIKLGKANANLICTNDWFRYNAFEVTIYVGFPSITYKQMQLLGSKQRR